MCNPIRLTLAILAAISIFAFTAPDADARIFRRLGSRVFAACSQQGSPTPACCSAPAASCAEPAGKPRSVVVRRTVNHGQLLPNIPFRPQPRFGCVGGQCHR